MNFKILSILVLVNTMFPLHVFAQSIGLGDIVRNIGDVIKSNSDYQSGYHDGQLRPAIGVQNYQILRANRTHPEWTIGQGWTYNHHVNMAYWNGTFYCEYISHPVGEGHAPIGAVMLTSSRDGKTWSKASTVFPPYPVFYVRDGEDKISFINQHQRMGFYVAPDGRLLILAFYGGNNGDGYGRVVREMYEDGSLSPIYTIRPNLNRQDELLYPLYTESAHQGFIKACNSLLADKVRRMQWWEEDQLAPDKDDFYRVPWIGDDNEKRPGKAFSFFTKEDGSVVGFFKARWVTTSKDGGETWTKPEYCESLTYGGAKCWAQRLENGRYALVYNPTDSPARHPLSIATSDDGENFDNLLNIHSEVPPKRYWGNEKRPGPQYVRGIVEGNGTPPGDDLWVVYSVNKEDLWISKVPVPIRWQVPGPVHDDFNSMKIGGEVKNWNIYSPQWCPVEIVYFPNHGPKCLQLKDKDPYDYAKAVRIFQKAEKQTISFQVFVESNPQVLDMEIVSANGARLVQTRIDTDGALKAKNGVTDYQTVQTLEPDTWYKLVFQTNAKTNEFDLKIADKTIAGSFAFSADGKAPERIIFRTGEYRLTDDVSEYKSGSNLKPGWDEPGCDEPVEESVFYIRDFAAVAEQ